MKLHSQFIDFLNSNRVYLDLLVSAYTGLNSVSILTGDKELCAVTHTLEYAVNNIEKQIDLMESQKTVDKTNVLEFFDSIQIYLDIMTTCYEALQYYFNYIGTPTVRNIASTISFAISKIVREYTKFHDKHFSSSYDSNKNDKGGENDTGKK